MKDLAKLCMWLGYIERIAVQVAAWRASAVLPFTTEKALREAERSIGCAFIEVVR